MAVTINDLIGNNVTSDYNKVSAFPTYEEFHPERMATLDSNLSTQEKYKFDFNTPAPSKVTEEELKAYEASTPYQPPKEVEFKSQDYDFLDRIITRPTFEEHSAPVFQKKEEIVKERDFNFDEMTGTKESVDQKKGLYEFTLNDKDRLSASELDAKLEQKSHSITNTENKVVTRERSVVREEKKARLNTKGKVILGVYITMILIVAILIGVHASDINNGVAVAPTSNSITDMYVETVDYMDAQVEMNMDLFDSVDFTSIQNLN